MLNRSSILPAPFVPRRLREAPLGLFSDAAPGGERPRPRPGLSCLRGTRHVPFDELAVRLVSYRKDEHAEEPALLALRFLSRGRTREALEAAELGLHRDPNDPDLLLVLARILRTLGDTRGARRALEQVEPLEPKNGAAPRPGAEACHSGRRRSVPAGCFRAATYHPPSPTELFPGSGYCARTRGARRRAPFVPSRRPRQDQPRRTSSWPPPLTTPASFAFRMRLPTALPIAS